MKNDGGPAFPINNNDVITVLTNNGNHPEGMSLRDYFAAKAMQGIYGGRNPEVAYFDIDIDKAVKLSYIVADAMLKAREQ